MKKKQFWRNCPECGKELGYGFEKTMKRAEKKSQLCNRCARLGEKHHSWKNYPEQYFCPICGVGIKASSRGNLTRAMRNKTKCKSCSMKERQTNWKEQGWVNEEFINSSRMSGRKHTEETKLKMSESTKNQVITDEHRKNMSLSHIGKTIPMKQRRKIRLSLLKNIEDRNGQVMPNYNPSSIPIIEEKARELRITDLQHAENGGEHHIKELGYWVGGYSKEKNVVIEYYEIAHERQVERDERRKREIIDTLGCEFVEIKE